MRTGLIEYEYEYEYECVISKLYLTANVASGSSASFVLVLVLDQTTFRSRFRLTRARLNARHQLESAMEPNFGV